MSSPSLGEVMPTKGVMGIVVAVGGRVAGMAVGMGVETAVKSVVGGRDVAVTVGSSATGTVVGKGAGFGELQAVKMTISKNRTNTAFFFANINIFLIDVTTNPPGG
jgi:hypothetical protein